MLLGFFYLFFFFIFIYFFFFLVLYILISLLSFQVDIMKITVIWDYWIHTETYLQYSTKVLCHRVVEIPCPTCPTPSLSLKTSKKFQFTCPDKFIALAKEEYPDYNFSYFSKKTYVMGTH